MDYYTVAKAKSMLGSGGVVVMDEGTCMVKAAVRIMRFYAHESCGWCIPCREGTLWLRKILTRFHSGEGQASDIVIQAEHIAKLKKRMNEILAERTGQPVKKVTADTERDNFMSAEEALEYGLVDEIIPAKEK
jgi:NADH-quinone oxidoreductase subunit F